MWFLDGFLDEAINGAQVRDIGRILGLEFQNSRPKKLLVPSKLSFLS